MNCQCCGGDRARLHGVESAMVKGNKLLLCTDCKREGHEPRHLLIIGAHSGKQVRDYIKHNRYCGQQLAANEVMV